MKNFLRNMAALIVAVAMNMAALIIAVAMVALIIVVAMVALFITEGQSWMLPDLSVQRKTTNGPI